MLRRMLVFALSGVLALACGDDADVITDRPDQGQDGPGAGLDAGASDSGGSGARDGGLVPDGASHTPGPGAWETVPGNAPARVGHTLTVLASGDVLLVGGEALVRASPGTQPRPVAQAEAWIFRAAENRFEAAGSSGTARAWHTATLLDDGRVLIAGGDDSAGDELSTTEIYDPQKSGSAAFSAGPPLPATRAHHAAVRLADGKVLVTGGLGGGSSDNVYIYEPAAGGAGRWLTPAVAMKSPRFMHDMLRLSSGKVLIVGGRTDTAELYDPTLGTFTVLQELDGYERRWPHLVPYRDRVGDKVLIVSDSFGSFGTNWKNSVFDPTDNSIVDLPFPGGAPFSAAAIALTDTTPLVCGGTYDHLAESKLFDTAPTPATWVATGDLEVGRAEHRLARLQDGSVLAVGGVRNDVWVNVAERFRRGAWPRQVSAPNITWTRLGTKTSDRLDAVWGSSVTDVWAAGTQGTLLHCTGNASCALTKVPASGGGPVPVFYALWGSGPNDVFAGGATLEGSSVPKENEAMWHFDGSSWREMALPADASAILAIWGSGPTDVYAVGYYGTLVRYDGRDWKLVAVDPDVPGDYTGIWGSGPDDIYVSGDSYGNVLHYDGKAWRALDLPVRERLDAVWAGGADDVFVVGNAGTVLRLNGGLWRPMETHSGREVQKVFGVGTRAFAIGDYELFYYAGTGTHWSVQRATGEDDYNAVWAAEDQVYVVGAEGLALRGTVSAP